MFMTHSVAEGCGERSTVSAPRPAKFILAHAQELTQPPRSPAADRREVGDYP
jgi:hypothetical protein